MIENHHTNNEHRKTNQKKEIFTPNHYQKDLIYNLINDFGSLIRNKQYSKNQSKKIQKQAKRLRFLGVLPFCSKHFFRIK